MSFFPEDPRPSLPAAAAKVSKRDLVARSIYLLAFIAAVVMSLRRLIKKPESTDFFGHLGFAVKMSDPSLNLYLPEQDPALHYPHFLLVPLRMLLDLLPAGSELLILTLFGLSMGLATVLILVDLRWFAERFKTLGLLQLLLFFFLFGRFLTDNFVHASLSIWVGALSLRGLRFLIDKRIVSGSLCIGIAGAMKLTPLLILPLLLYRRMWRGALASGLVAALLILVFPLTVLPFAQHRRLLTQFYDAMISPVVSSAPVDSVKGAPGDLEKAGARSGLADYRWRWRSYSLNGTLNHLFHEDPPGRLPDVPHYYLFHLDEYHLFQLKAAWIAGLFLLAILGFLRARRIRGFDGFLIEASIVMLFSFIFAPITRNYHLIGIVLPCAIFCMRRKKDMTRAQNLLWWGCVAFFAIAGPLRQKPLLGRELWGRIDQYGFMHFGMVCLLAWIALYAFDDTKSKTQLARSKAEAKLPKSKTSPSRERRSVG